jgi:hypothetical protein
VEVEEAMGGGSGGGDGRWKWRRQWEQAIPEGCLEERIESGGGKVGAGKKKERATGLEVAKRVWEIGSGLLGNCRAHACRGCLSRGCSGR